MSQKYTHVWSVDNEEPGRAINRKYMAVRRRVSDRG